MLNKSCPEEICYSNSQNLRVLNVHVTIARLTTHIIIVIMELELAY